MATYQAALDGLPQQGDSDAQSKIMTLLIARDDVARALAESDDLSAVDVVQITDLDERLKSASVTIDAAAGRTTLINWRQSIHPLESAWWWSLDERAAAAEPRHNPLWTIPAAVLFVLSLSVIADTITTLRSGGLNGLSAFGALMQSVLALLAGSAFLSGGREFLENLFAKLGVNRKFQGASRVWLAAGVLALTLGISLLLPDVVARYRNRLGDQFFANKQYPNAVQNYQQAVALKPSFVKAHFNLALAYDKNRDYPNAIGEYERSIDSDPRNYTAYNNVARLYILSAKDYKRALARLDYLREHLTEIPAALHYFYYKNEGWAYLEQHEYRLAEGDLRASLNDRDGAAAHYLLGRVYAEQNRTDEAKQQWNIFIKLLTKPTQEVEEEIEPEWMPDAQEQLLKGGAK